MRQLVEGGEFWDRREPKTLACKIPVTRTEHGETVEESENVQVVEDEPVAYEQQSSESGSERTSELNLHIASHIIGGRHL